MKKTANNNLTNKNTGRRIASLFMLSAFIVLIPSGILMHLNDTPGLNNDKFFAMAVHNISAMIFVVSGIFHIKFNLKLIKKYIAETWFGTAGKESSN
ncbi:MAG TPA: DUF4405 domain-containing protein [Spirochaetota bacterium]|nr:DUF4405 domain-containing protein [Spirochaetota bacterium]